MAKTCYGCREAIGNNPLDWIWSAIAAVGMEKSPQKNLNSTLQIGPNALAGRDFRLASRTAMACVFGRRVTDEDASQFAAPSFLQFQRAPITWEARKLNERPWRIVQVLMPAHTALRVGGCADVARHLTIVVRPSRVAIFYTRCYLHGWCECWVCSCPSTRNCETSSQ